MKVATTLLVGLLALSILPTRTEVIRRRHPVAASLVLGQVAEEVPAQVQEGLELPDSPAGDAAEGDANAQAPAVDPSGTNAEQPATEQPPDTEQPNMEP